MPGEEELLIKGQNKSDVNPASWLHGKKGREGASTWTGRDTVGAQ